MTRPVTDPPPNGVLGWAREVFISALGVAILLAIAMAIYVLHMRRTVARVESWDCRAVVFAAGAQRWTHRQGEVCEDFEVGELWLIEWNRNGAVEPIRRRR